LIYLEKFVADLQKIESLDDRYHFLFRTYYNESFKFISRSRKRFSAFLIKSSSLIGNKDFIEPCELLETSAKSWEIAANLCYKLAISKRLKIIQDIGNQLTQAFNAESNIINILKQVTKPIAKAELPRLSHN
jgi:hypothetical protein